MNRFLRRFFPIMSVVIGCVCIACGEARADRKETDGRQYGLRFETYPLTGSRRTSIVLENNLPIEIGKGFAMSFHLYTRPDNVFGYIFRMIVDNQRNIDLLYSVGRDDNRYPALAIRDSLYALSHELEFYQWIPVKIILSKATNQVTIHYGNRRFSYDVDLAGAEHVKIAFGRCPFQPFNSSDIASVDVRDISLSRNGTVFRSWKLRKHRGDVCLDSVERVPALVTNGKWLLDQHVKWTKIYAASVSDNAQFAFDGRKLYVVQPDSSVIRVLNLSDHSTQGIPVVAGRMVSNSPNQMYYDSTRKGLVSYNLDEHTYSVFSFETQTWSDAPKSVKQPTYQNNTANYSLRDSAIYSFGGYGFFKYNNYLVKNKLFTDEKTQVQLTGIAPRYCAASLIVGDTLYIFGGRGNPSGSQVMNPRNYYDLYAVDLNTLTSKKLWDSQGVNYAFLPGENMVYDEKTDCFYVFSDLQGGSLLRMGRQNGEIDIVSNAINENLEGLYLYMNLYYAPELQKLFGIFYKKPDASTYELSVYSINYPPLAPEDSQQQIDGSDDSRSAMGYYLLGILVLLSGGVLWWIRWRRTESVTGALDPVAEVPQPTALAGRESMSLEPREFDSASICLLGAFKVLDKQGLDITQQFTPILRNFLSLLLLNAQKDGKGISVRRLMGFLWPDKREESAKNNRNVHLSKLRSLGEQVGYMDISYQNEYMNIQLGSGIACDYLEATRLLDEIDATSDPDKEKVMKLLELLLRGELLPGVEAEWLDGFKSSFSDKTISCLTMLSRNPAYQQTDEVLLIIADILFIHDVLSEEALRLKCSIYYGAGKKGLAKAVYDHYCKGYLNLLGEEFELSLADVVNGKLVK